MHPTYDLDTLKASQFGMCLNCYMRVGLSPDTKSPAHRPRGLIMVKSRGVEVCG